MAGWFAGLLRGLEPGRWLEPRNRRRSSDLSDLSYDPRETGAWSFTGEVVDLGHPYESTTNTIGDLWYSHCWDPSWQYVELRVRRDLVAWLGWHVEGPEGEDLSPPPGVEPGEQVSVYMAIEPDWHVDYRPLSASVADEDGTRVFLSNAVPWPGKPLPMASGGRTGTAYTYPSGFRVEGVYLDLREAGGGLLEPGQQQELSWEGDAWTVRNHGMQAYEEGYVSPSIDLPTMDQPTLAWR